MIDPNSATWSAVKALAESTVVDACARLESPGTPIGETEFERGRIWAMRELLRLETPRMPIPSTDPVY